MINFQKLRSKLKKQIGKVSYAELYRKEARKISWVVTLVKKDHNHSDHPSFIRDERNEMDYRTLVVAL